MNRPIIKQIIFAITTRCNLACPDCCSNIPYLDKHEDVTWDYIEQAAKFLRGKIFHVKITGGEPLIHRRFDEFAPKLKEVFGVPLLGIETNGLLAPQHEKALRCFDYIHVTVYEPGVFKHAEEPVRMQYDNSEERKWLREHFAPNIVGEVRLEHSPRRRRGSGQPCAKGTADIAAYWYGKIYPCCVASGIPGAQGLVLDEHWQEKASDIPWPCADCWFSPD